MAKFRTLNERLEAEARPRAERAARLRAAGETYTAIGLLLGVSRQRAQAIIARHNRRKAAA
jgi:hypothetical protein